MSTNRRIPLAALLLVVLLLVACAPPSPQEGIAEGPTPEVFVFPGPVVTLLISTEDIPQNNCAGVAELSQTVERSHVVTRTLDMGTSITVDASGQVGIPEVGQVGVGVAVAAYYQVSYGSQDTVKRAVTVAAAGGTNMLHTVRQYESWETGEVLIVAGGANVRLPYSFRKDFSMETLPPANLGCPGQAESAGLAAAPTLPPPTTTPPPPPPTTPPIQPIETTQTLCAATVMRADVQNWAQVGMTDKATTQTYINVFGDKMKTGSGFVSGFNLGDTIPVGILIATDFGNGESEDYLSFPVNPVVHYRSWGLFEVTDSFVATNANGGWCATIR